MGVASQKGVRLSDSDHLKDKFIRGYLLPGWEEKRQPDAHREETFLCNSKLCITHRPGMSRKVDPCTSPIPKVGGIGGSDRDQATRWRPLVGVPLPPGTLLNLRLSSPALSPPPPPNHLALLLFFHWRLLAAEPPSSERTDWMVGGGGGGGTALRFCDC